MKLLHGDCTKLLGDIPDNSIDAVVTDPPYELGFMGKKWDGTGIAYSIEMWSEVLRVLKPGGHLLSFGGTRTYHRMACAIEDAGFEIRDQIQYLYGSGFPKSYNISKGIDKKAGAEREVVGKQTLTGTAARTADDKGAGSFSPSTSDGRPKDNARIQIDITAPATPEAQQWDGWGSALKPAVECVCMARKPLSEKTIVENVLKWGTGGINVDDCRIELNGEIVPINVLEDWSGFGELKRPDYEQKQNNQGRFPANVIMDLEAGRMLDEQSGSVGGDTRKSKSTYDAGYWGEAKPVESTSLYNDKGGASRFFYCAKSSRRERNAGLEGMEENSSHPSGNEWATTSMWNGENGDDEWRKKNPNKPHSNHHPTVKPISLMRYLCRLITPPNGTVLDPFMGSGTTGCAAVQEGFDFVGIEQDAEYLEIARRRIEYWSKEAEQEQPTLWEAHDII